MAHLLIENSFNGLLYRWLKRDAPAATDTDSTKAAKEKLWINIVKFDFAKKYSLIEPFFSLHFPKISGDPWKINDLRNDIFHGRAIKEATFNGMPISEENTIGKIFLLHRILLVLSTSLRKC